MLNKVFSFGFSEITTRGQIIMKNISNYVQHAKRKILIVEDEPINQQILSMILQSEYDVLLAGNGQDALDILHNEHKTISLVLLDLVMPVMDGFEVLRCIEDDPALKRIPVIVLTSDKSAEIQSLKLGAQDFIVKPYDMPEVILARIKRSILLAEETNLILSTQKDNLTGLFTKKYFYEYIHEFDVLNSAASMDAISINIKRFHIFNEMYGHEVGDKLLVYVARELKNLTTIYDGIVARVDSDTFFLYIASQDDYNFLINETLPAAVKNLELDAPVEFRIGVKKYANKDDSVEKRFDHAIRASNQDKHSFENTITYYDEQMHNKEIYYEKLLHHFDKAIKNHEFKLYLQPKFNIRGDEPVLSSAEALVRWVHPEYGMVSPGVFIPLFEENGLVRKLDYYIWNESFQAIRNWERVYGHTLPISINVSRVDLLDDNLLTHIMDIIDKHQIDIKNVYLEVTESAYSDEPELIVNRVTELSEKGFMIEIDDFGSGYSSLGMVTSLPLDVLKIDMSFVKQMLSNPKAKKMVEIVIEIAKYLNLKTVAEGVENKEQLDVLKEMGCDIVQGYYMSKPISVEEFTDKYMKR